MLLSTAIPMVIAAMVIVIISKGISSRPIIPRIKKAAIKLGTTPISDNLIFLNRIINIVNIPIITNPKVKIWDLNKLCNKLLNKIKTPASLYSLSSNPILFLSKFIPTIYFGLFTGLAMLLAMISVLTLLPTLILTVKPFGK